MRQMSSRKGVLLTFLVFLAFSQSIGISESFGNINMKETEKGWFRVCDVSEHQKSFLSSGPFEIDADQCPHGAWLSKPVAAGCVCLNGLWAIASKWCDEDYFLFYGKGHCFNLRSDAQRVAFLGHPKKPFAPLNFLTKRNGHVFKEFTDFVSMPYEYELEYSDQNLNKTVVQLLPYDSTNIGNYFLMELSEQALPSMLSPSYASTRLQICIEIENNRRRSISDEIPIIRLTKIREAIKNLRLVELCPDGVATYSSIDYKHKISTIPITVGQGVHVKSGRMEGQVDTCGSCVSEHMHRKRRAVVKTKQSSGKTPSIQIPLSVSEAEPPVLGGGNSDEEKQRLVNEETLRVIRTEVLFLLDREKPPKNLHLNWQLLQRAKEAFIKVCPEVEIPKFLVNSLFRVFRYLYIHSKDANPYSHFFEEGPQTVRIAEALDSCIKDAAPLQFEYKLEKVEGSCAPKDVTVDAFIIDPATNQSTVNGTKVEKTIYCQCSDKINVVNFNYTKNVSNPNEFFNLTQEEFLLPTEYTYSLIPVSEKFNSSYHDFPIETIWKIVTFAHYYCAKYFKDRPADHSAMLIKFESLFNSDIVFRWVHPGQRTNETWQNLFNAFNLQKFANSIDICVASAKHVSDYPEWITRPTLEHLSRKKRSVKIQQLRNGQSYCLVDPMDPVYKLGVNASDLCYEWNRVE